MIKQLLEKNKTLTVVVIAFFTAILTFKVDWKKTDIDYNKVTLQNYQELYESIKADMIILKKENEELKRQVLELQMIQVVTSQNSLMFSNSIDDLPFPYWVKARDGTMVKLNKMYEDLYLKPKNLRRSDYIDKTDYAIWTKSESDRFRKNDLEVITSKSIKTYYEVFEVNGRIYNTKVFKFPIYLNNNVIGVGGIIIPDEYLKK